MGDLRDRIEGWLEGDGEHTAAALKVPGRCHIDADGRLAGPVTVHFNDPWPCRNGYASGFAKPAHGVVLHTEDGYQSGTVAWFNNPASEASAWFAVSETGDVWQFAPVGSGWCSWAQESGNTDWYSIEDADNADPSKPFTAAQVTSIALITECLSRHDGFPLAAATDPFTQHGVTLHSEGGVPFGDHLECPGSVRGAQRPAILELARAIRAGEQPVTVQDYTTTGELSLLEVAELPAHRTAPSTILRRTVVRDGEFSPPLAAYINTGDLTKPMPQGIVLRVPAAA